MFDLRSQGLAVAHFCCQRRASVVAVAGLVTGCGWPRPRGSVPTVLRYADHEPLANMRTRFLAETFFAGIARESQGRLVVEPHWNGALSTSYDNLKTIAAGQVADMGVVVPEYDARALPLQQVFKGFPAGPAGAGQVRVLRRAYDEIPAFDAELARAGVRRIFIATGHPVAFFSRAPLASLAALRGRRWRTASFWHTDFLRNAGAEPVTLPWGPAVFEALHNGALDGLMVNVDSGIDLQVPAVAPHVLLSRRLWLGHVYVIAVNAAAWERLPQQDRAAIARAAEAAYPLLGSAMDAGYAQLLASLRAGGATVRELSADEVDAFARAVRATQVQDAWAARQAAAGVAGAPDVLARMCALLPAQP